MTTPIDVKKIARLANLELSEEELTAIEPKVAEILTYFDRLSAINTASVTITPSNEHKTVLHEDTAQPSSISLDFSPYVEDHSFKVPKVIE